MWSGIRTWGELHPYAWLFGVSRCLQDTVGDNNINMFRSEAV